MSSQNLVLIIGGTGAQGNSVVKALVADGKYSCRVLTRSSTSESAKALSSLPGVELFEGDSYHEPTLRQAFSGCTYAFTNTNGFALGEKAEIYWEIRVYELAAEFKVKHFLYAGLIYASKLGNFDPKYRTGYLDGKGKVSDYISAQPTSPMKWSILTSCLYIEGLNELMQPFPRPSEPDTLTTPSTSAGCSTPPLSNGLYLNVATEDISWADLASPFSSITGKKAIYMDVSLDQYFSFPIFPNPEAKVTNEGGNLNDPTLFTIRENFWNSWKDNL
ncbi:uncharacterized protein PAC_18553 [Phialocephala subalpina]|uniref:NmrA-like domain-containing protein n=1 Tax=Phialocephala subalpina TaxID=576137 RepID=A0A1L7XUE7_9HELO|nr:uncharacterized protein PAC_18553 [Phialocephala subalpina]